jgi:hypothetical protein
VVEKQAGSGPRQTIGHEIFTGKLFVLIIFLTYVFMDDHAGA